MRIAFITTEYVTETNFDGGLANYINRTALSLLKLGHEPVVIVASDNNREFYYQGIKVFSVKINFEKLGKWMDFGVCRKVFRAFYFLGLSYVLNNRLKKVHFEHPFDIVQYPQLGAVGIFRLKEIPSVIRVSSYTPLIQKANKMKGGYQQNFWEVIAMKRADSIFCPSILIADLIQNVINQTVYVIESPYCSEPINLDSSVYEQHLNEKEYLLFFGSISVLKGIYSIAEILEKLLEEHQNLYFVFVGKDLGTEQNTPMMDHVFQEAGIYRNRVLYLGKLRHEQLYPIIDHSLAVVLPSRIDNFPNTCIEAMAHGKIVIGTYQTSFEQLIEDGKSGYLCKVDDDIGLLEKIELALKLNKEETYIMSSLATERINQLRPEIVVKNLVSYYESVVIDFQNRKI